VALKGRRFMARPN